ncbi:MAG: hypothetical protein HZB67_05105 [Candidatus Aenigmarchaeota archaeon]|nr:hypothetical protein [Candidatus Aenigmarchaeota archaeon]
MLYNPNAYFSGVLSGIGEDGKHLSMTKRARIISDYDDRNPPEYASLGEIDVYSRLIADIDSRISHCHKKSSIRVLGKLREKLKGKREARLHKFGFTTISGSYSRNGKNIEDSLKQCTGEIQNLSSGIFDESLIDGAYLLSRKLHKRTHSNGNGHDRARADRTLYDFESKIFDHYAKPDLEKMERTYTDLARKLQDAGVSASEASRSIRDSVYNSERDLGFGASDVFVLQSRAHKIVDKVINDVYGDDVDADKSPERIGLYERIGSAFRRAKPNLKKAVAICAAASAIAWLGSRMADDDHQKYVNPNTIPIESRMVIENKPSVPYEVTEIVQSPKKSDAIEYQMKKGDTVWEISRDLLMERMGEPSNQAILDKSRDILHTNSLSWQDAKELPAGYRLIIKNRITIRFLNHQQ